MVIDDGRARHPEEADVLAEILRWFPERYRRIAGVSVHGDDAVAVLAPVWEPWGAGRVPGDPNEGLEDACARRIDGGWRISTTASGGGISFYGTEEDGRGVLLCADQAERPAALPRSRTAGAPTRWRSATAATRSSSGV